MGGFGGYNEKKKKKQKQGKGGANSVAFGSRPEYTMPEVIKPERKDK